MIICLRPIYKVFFAFRFFFLLSVPGIAQDFYPALEKLQKENQNGNYDWTLKQVLAKVIKLQASMSDTLLLAQHYNLAGKIYLNQSDVGEAKKYFDAGYSLNTKNYGENSIYAAYSCALYSKYHSFLINIDSAFYFAGRAITLCHKNKSNLKFIPVAEIYRG